MKTKKIISVWMAILIVMMPMIYADTGNTSTTFDLFATVPTATKDNSIKITGNTKPNIDVVITLNKARVAELVSDSNGDFESDEITLIREDNEFIIKATDETGNIRTLTYNVKTDMTPPIVTYTDVPKGSTVRSIEIKGTTSEPVTIDWRVSNITTYTSVPVTDAFTFNIDLIDGMNILELAAKDTAGNTDRQIYNIAYDVAPPQFTSTNLDKLEPCYLDFPSVKGKKIDLTGTVSEKSTILVYVNHESTPSKVRTTDDSGYFRVQDVELKGGTIKTSTTPQQTTLSFGDQYEHHIKIVAKDLAGNEISTEKTILCGGCGGGASGYTLNTAASLQTIMPSILLPKLLIEGLETITIPFNLTYTGLNKAILQNVRITPVLIAPEYASDYDNDKITTNIIQQNSPDRRSAIGVIQIQIQKFDPLGAAEPDATNYRRQYNVSQHRFGQCTFTTNIHDANYGCMKFFLVMEIPYQEETTQTYLDPNVGQTQDQIKRENKVQKLCIPHIEIPIDTITDQFIPTKMVKRMIGNIDHVLKKIEPIQKMIDDATTWATYTCIASTGTLVLSKLAELTSCQIGEWVSATGNARWHSEIAEAGLCEMVYHPDFDKKDDNSPGIKGNQRTRNSCKTCSGVIGLRKWIEYEVMHRACDRVGCPAAKTFKAYINDKGSQARDITTYINEHYEKAKAQEINTENKKQELLFKHGVAAVKNAVYIGSDCGFVTNTKIITPTYSGGTPVAGTHTGVLDTKGIKELYLLAKDTENRKYCTQYLRAAKPECCGIEYDREWGTACGIGRTFGINMFPADTFDELSESTCYAARQAGQPTAPGTGLDCSGGMLWNAIAGFCEPNTGKAVSEVVYTGMHYKPRNQDAEENRVNVFVKPVIKTKEQVEDYKVYRGYALNKIRYDENNATHRGASKLTQSLYEVYDTGDFSNIFKDEKTSESAKKKALKAAICTDVEPEDCTSARIDRVYTQIMEIIGGGPEKEYIVRADTGLLRAIQCICFPAVKAWVDQWVQILTMLRNCLATVAIGKGDSGVCDEFIAQAVCDRIYDIIKCFSSKLGSPGVGKRISGEVGIGSIIGILTNTASEMSKTMGSRYGETSMWTALFNEQALVHGVCMWAFTGKYDLKIDELIQQTTENIAIESMPLITECKRYFRGYNPNTNPSGLTTWAYQCGIALIAGAKIDYRIKLICSDDYSCAEQDGYRNGECDCVQTGKKELVREYGTLEKGESFNTKFTWLLQAGQGGSQYRYDHAVLYYEWTDPKTNQKRSNSEDLTTRYISQGGQEPFGFCAFDPFTLAYRCQFGKQEGGITIKKINPNYKETKHPTKGTSAFAINQPFTFDVQVKQKISDDASKQAESKKFMFYQIINHAGNTVKEIKVEDGTTDAITFESNGDYSEEITIDLSDVNMQNYLDQIPGEKPTAIKISNGISRIVDSSDYLYSHDAKVKDSTGKTDYTSTAAIVVIDSDYISMYEFQSKIGTKLIKGKQILENQSYSAGSQITASKQVDNKEYNINIIIKDKPELDETVEIYIPKRNPVLKSPWNTGDPADWKAVFTMYDANKFGEVTDQITISPDGTTQRKEVTFKVMKSTLDQASKGVTVVQATPEEKTAAEITLPDKYLIKENKQALYTDKTGSKKIVTIKKISDTEITAVEYKTTTTIIIPIAEKNKLIKIERGEIWKTTDGNKIKIRVEIDADNMWIEWTEHPNKKGTKESISANLLHLPNDVQESQPTLLPPEPTPSADEETNWFEQIWKEVYKYLAEKERIAREEKVIPIQKTEEAWQKTKSAIDQMGEQKILDFAPEERSIFEKIQTELEKGIEREKREQAIEQIRQLTGGYKMPESTPGQEYVPLPPESTVELTNKHPSLYALQTGDYAIKYPSEAIKIKEITPTTITYYAYLYEQEITREKKDISTVIRLITGDIWKTTTGNLVRIENPEPQREPKSINLQIYWLTGTRKGQTDYINIALLDSRSKELLMEQEGIPLLLEIGEEPTETIEKPAQIESEMTLNIMKEVKWLAEFLSTAGYAKKESTTISGKTYHTNTISPLIKNEYYQVEYIDYIPTDEIGKGDRLVLTRILSPRVVFNDINLNGFNSWVTSREDSYYAEEGAPYSQGITLPAGGTPQNTEARKAVDTNYYALLQEINTKLKDLFSTPRDIRKEVDEIINIVKKQGKRDVLGNYEKEITFQGWNVKLRYVETENPHLTLEITKGNKRVFFDDGMPAGFLRLPEDVTTYLNSVQISDLEQDELYFEESPGNLKTEYQRYVAQKMYYPIIKDILTELKK